MSPEEMKAVVKRAMFDGYNQGDFSVLDECIQPDYVRHTHHGHPSASSLADHKSQLAERKQVFADSRFHIDEMIAEGTQVAVRFTMTGRHVGTYLGLEGTGREIARKAAVFFRFRDGKIAESHAVFDVYGTLAQIRGEI